MNKKSVVIFTCADDNNFQYAIGMWNSLTKFHSPLEIDMIFYTTEKRPEMLHKIPTGIKIVDLESYLKVDPQFWYRQKPVIAEPLMDEYELVLGMDVDQIVTGDLSYILNTKDYDVCGVLNFNKEDANTYGLVQGWGILPIEYMNCGLVAMRSKKFVHDWKIWCFSNQFSRLQYREQDGLNALVYHGNWNARILEHGDGPAKEHSFYGLFAKDYWNRVVLKDDKLIIPTLGDGSIPAVVTELKVIHFGTGNNPGKYNYRTKFQEDVIKRLDYLISNEKK